jgi:deoxyhypusine synthase
MAGTPIAGPNFEAGETVDDLLQHYAAMGLQASHVGAAEAVLKGVLERRASDATKVGVVLAYTSNMVSSGLREVFTYLIREGFVDALVSTAGGLEEDIIKCFGDTLVGDFTLPGAQLRAGNLNRVGNLLIPNNNYVNFEEFFVPVLRDVHLQQCANGCTAVTEPSAILRATGKHLAESPSSLVTNNASDSVIASCYLHNVPVFCPAFTDGSMGDMLFFYNITNKGMVIDPLADERKFRRLLDTFAEVNVISVGAGLPKHNALRAAMKAKCRLRSVVLLTTSSETDGCTSSGSRDDDLSAGQLAPDTEYVRVNADATLTFPFLVARLFCK